MHNYERVILKMIESGKIPTGPGQLYSISCQHDTWCGINSGRECNCNVDVTVHLEPKTPEQAAEGKQGSV